MGKEDLWLHDLELNFYFKLKGPFLVCAVKVEPHCQEENRRSSSGA
jgi:hypothetical protein